MTFHYKLSPCRDSKFGRWGREFSSSTWYLCTILLISIYLSLLPTWELARFVGIFFFETAEKQFLQPMHSKCSSTTRYLLSLLSTWELIIHFYERSTWELIEPDGPRTRWWLFNIVICPIAWRNQYNLTHMSIPEYPRTMLPDLENIKKVFVEKYNEKAKANKAKVATASKASEACLVWLSP